MLVAGSENRRSRPSKGRCPSTEIVVMNAGLHVTNTERRSARTGVLPAALGLTSPCPSSCFSSTSCSYIVPPLWVFAGFWGRRAGEPSLLFAPLGFPALHILHLLLAQLWAPH